MQTFFSYTSSVLSVSSLMFEEERQRKKKKKGFKGVRYIPSPSFKNCSKGTIYLDSIEGFWRTTGGSSLSHLTSSPTFLRIFVFPPGTPAPEPSPWLFETVPHLPHPPRPFPETNLLTYGDRVYTRCYYFPITLWSLYFLQLEGGGRGGGRSRVTFDSQVDVHRLKFTSTFEVPPDDSDQ